MSRHNLKNMEAILESLDEKRKEAKEKEDWDEVKRIDNQIKEIAIELKGLESYMDM